MLCATLAQRMHAQARKKHFAIHRSLSRFRDRLSLPLIAAPMFLVSGVELVVAACRNGVIGWFPTVNCRSPEQLEAWLGRDRNRLRQHSDASGKPAAPLLREPDRASLQCAAGAGSAGAAATQAGDRHHLCWIARAGVGAAARCRRAGVRRCRLDPPRRACGGSRRRRAGAADRGRRRADRLAQSVRVRPRGARILRRTIWCSPAASATATRCARRRRSAAISATWAPNSSRRARAWRTSSHKEMLVASSADDILLTTAFTGLQTNMLRPSIVAAGLDPDDLPARGAIDIGKDIDVGARENRPKRWRDIWSAGHATSGVTEVLVGRRARGADPRGISRCGRARQT